MMQILPFLSAINLSWDLSYPLALLGKNVVIIVKNNQKTLTQNAGLIH